MADLLARPAADDAAPEPLWVRVSAVGLSTCIGGQVLLSAAISRYGLDALLGRQPFDAGVQQDLAQEVLSLGRPPGYPVFLALVEAVWDGAFAIPATILLQTAVALATLLGLFFVARRVSGRSAWGVIAVTLVALNELWVIEAIRPRETFLYGAVLLALVGLAVYAREVSRWTLVAAGVLAALGLLTRVTGVVLLPAVVLVLALEWRGLTGRRIAVAAVLVASFAAPVAGWAVYQQMRFGSVAIAGNDGAANLLKGNNEALSTIYPFVDVDRLSPVLHEPISRAIHDRGGSADDVRAEFLRRSLEFVSASPWEALALAPKKLAAFFGPIQFPLGSGTVRQAPGGGWAIENYEARSVTRGDGIMALPGVLAFFAGLVRWRSLTRAGQLTVLVVALTALVHVATWGQTRFRLPYDPILALLCVDMAASALLKTTGVSPGTPAPVRTASS